MRLWSLHPRYLDPQGLVALWREALLARAVLQGKTRGYRHHPQLLRFQEHPTPRSAICAYLGAVRDEAVRRGYRFDSRKAGPQREIARIGVTRGQLDYEWDHLLRKLSQRSPEHYRRWRKLAAPACHPAMRCRRGDVEAWEKRTAPEGGS